MQGLDSLNVSNDTYRMEIIHPGTGVAIKDKNGKAAYIDVYSMSSSVADKHRRSSYDEARKRRAARAKANDPSYDEAVEKQAMFLAGLTAGWYLVNPATQEAIDLEFNEDNAIDLYASTNREWIRRQVDTAVQEDGNFLPTSEID